MSPWIALSLYTWLQLALGQNIPEADPRPFIPDCEGDVLFLTDSSGSVSYKEFSQVKAFVADLIQPFTFGPQDVQTSVIHISTVPVVEFPFDQHGSSASVQRAIRDMTQRMGDTNTGQALSLAKEKLFTDEAGARPGVPKVLVWVTDGISTDDISQPMELLKDMGVTVFIVSTGRGNYLELSQAASQPTEKHLHFVDVDDLHIITKELRDDIIEVIRAQRLKALDLTTRSFRLTWPRLLSISTGYYVVEYALMAEPHRKLRMNVAGDQTEVLVRGLAPGTTYNVTLIPESNEQFVHHQNIKVTTLKEVIWGEKLKALDINTTSFRLTWPQLLSIDTGHYLVEYTSMADPQKKLSVKVAGDQPGVVLKDLAPGTRYNVTLILDSNQLYARPQTIQVSTLKEVVWTEDLKVLDVTPSSFRLTWPRLLSIKTGYYVVEYAPVLEPHRKGRMTVAGDQTGVVVKDLAPGTRYKVTVTPESNEQYIQPQTVQVTTMKEVIWTENLKVLDVTPSSFRLTWPRLLFINTGYYLVEYAPVSEPHRKVIMNVTGDQTGVVVRNLAPGTRYTVTVKPESKQYIQPQTVQVTTLKEVIWTENLKVLDVTPSSFRLTWPRLLFINTGYYLVEYAPVSEPHRKVRMNVTGDQTGVVVRNLAPGISYTVTVKPESKQYIQPQTVQVTTLKEVVWIENLKVLDVTPSSFRLTWPRLLSTNTGYYVVEYASVSEPHRKVRMNVPGDQTGVVVKDLAPGTSYKVTVTPESNEQYIQPQTVQVTTLKDMIWTENLKVIDVTHSSFRLTWPQLLSISTGYYVVEYSPVSEPHRKVRMNVAGDQTGVVVSNLTPGTIYTVTVNPESREQNIQPQSLQVTTLKEVIWTENLKVLDVTPTGFRLTWPQLLSISTGYYLVEYAPVSEPHRKVRMNVTGDQTGVVVRNLAPGISYTVTVKPESKQYIQSQTVQVITLKEVIWIGNLKVLDVTHSSFRLTWPRLFSTNTGYYVVEYAPVSEPYRKVRLNVPGDQTGVVVKDLAPGTSYTITVTPESNEQYIQPQTVQVTTSKDIIWTENLKVLDVTPSSFRLTWPPLLSINTGYYVVEYAPVSEPHRKVRMTVAGDQTGVVVSNLAPGASYKVTVTPESRGQYIQPQTVQVTTLKEVIWTENLKVLDVTPSSFRLTWPQMLSISTGYYLVEYAPVSEPHRKVRMNVTGDQIGVVVRNLAPGISYTVTVKPESKQYIQPQTVQVTTSREVIWTEDLKVLDVTPWSFRLTWPQLLSIYTGYYQVEYAPLSEPDRKVIVNVAGDRTGVEVQYLAPGTIYKVTVTPKSNEQYIQPKSMQVTTLKEVIWTDRLKVFDVTASSFRVTWPRLLSQTTGYYVVEYTPVAEPGQKRTMLVAGDQTGVVLRNLAPGTRYNVTVIPDSNEQYIPPQSAQVTTLEDRISPAQILISKSSSRRFQVSWSPTPDSVVGYQILYGPLPGNSVKLFEVDGSRNSTIVDNLSPNTTYLVTVTALYKSGQEKALSAKACTEEENSRVRHMHLEDMGNNMLKVTWDSADGSVVGYRVRCRRQSGTSSLISVAPKTHSVLLPGITDGGTNTICVQPVYRNKPGKSRCKKARLQPATLVPGYMTRGPS